MALIQRDRIDDDIEVLRLDRPERRNALSTDLLQELLVVLRELAADELLRVVILSTTSVRALCAGVDVTEPLDYAGGLTRMDAFVRFYALLEAFPLPTIAVCVGNCVGAGAEIVSGVDLRVVGDNLKLAWAGAILGVPIGPARLTSLVGLSHARDLVFTGRVIGAEEALRMGLARISAPASVAEQAAIALARDVARTKPHGLRWLKDSFRHLEDSEGKVAYENGLLRAFQRDHGGLPQGTRTRPEDVPGV